MKNIFNVQKVCGFYVSNMHFATMILPYVNKNVKNGTKFHTFLEYNLEENMNKVLKSVIGHDEDKKKVLEIKWTNFELDKFSKVEKELKTIDNGDNTILVCGDEDYINWINQDIEKYINKWSKRMKTDHIKIINCYEVNNFNQNIKEILNRHDKIINTSGEKEISEIFEDYKKGGINNID